MWSGETPALWLVHFTSSCQLQLGWHVTKHTIKACSVPAGGGESQRRECGCREASSCENFPRQGLAEERGSCFSGTRLGGVSLLTKIQQMGDKDVVTGGQTIGRPSSPCGRKEVSKIVSWLRWEGILPEHLWRRVSYFCY